jgi:hypothetical protein
MFWDIGRIQYSSGDTESAVRLFLGLLRYSLQMDASDTDAVVIDDFQQALEACTFSSKVVYMLIILTTAPRVYTQDRRPTERYGPTDSILRCERVESEIRKSIGITAFGRSFGLGRVRKPMGCFEGEGQGRATAGVCGGRTLVLFVRSVYLGTCVLTVIVILDYRTLLVGSSYPEFD